MKIDRYRRGWFFESARHSLAARGIKTYHSKKSRILKKQLERVTSPEERDRLLAELREKQMLGTKKTQPDVSSRRSQRIREYASMPTEELIEHFMVSDRSAAEKEALNVYEQELDALRRYEEKVKDLRKQKKILEQQIQDTVDDVARDELLQQLEEVNEALEFYDVEGLLKQKQELLDKIDILRGKGSRGIVKPGYLTEEQLRRRLGKDRAEQIIRSIEQIPDERLEEEFRKTFRTVYPEGVLRTAGDQSGVVMVSAVRPEVVEKLPEGMRLTVNRIITPSEMRQFLTSARLRTAVVHENPLRRPRSNIVQERREELLKRVENVQSQAMRRQVRKPVEMQTVPAKTPYVPEVAKQPFMKGVKRKDIVTGKLKPGREPVSEAVKRLREKEAAQKAGLAAAREKRMQYAVPAKIAREESKKRKEWREALGEESEE